MIWNCIKRQNWEFHPEPLEESRWNPLNPARGWYAVYTFQAEQKIDPEELKWSLREGETVALALLDIGAFRDRPLDKQALDNITPQVEVKSRRIGGATFQVPTEIRPDRKESISMKNLIAFARKRSGKSMADKLAAEIMDAYNNQGGAYKRKEDMHRMAEANRAFAHFRF